MTCRNFFRLLLMPLYLIIFLLFIFNFLHISISQSCQSDGNKIACDSSPSNNWDSHDKTKRYLLYDVNPGEGFNLRRDVYMRVAVLVKKLNQKDPSHDWVLVLPPWGPLYHWKSKNIGFQAQIKWSHFFDIPSLTKYVPVVELEEFLDSHGYELDSLYYLQHYAEGWTDSGWEEKYNIRDCIESPPYKKTKKGNFVGRFWGYDGISTQKFLCMSIQGYSSTLLNFLISSNESAIMLDRAETILHDTFGDAEYWTVRRSMVFSKKLTRLGDEFRKHYLNSTDEPDKTMKHPDWQVRPLGRSTLGGPYIAAHLRRRDFVSARPKEVPSVQHAAQEISKHMENIKIDKLFVATDASNSEFRELQNYIPSAVRFTPTKEVHKDVLDGGVAIIDQWICAHARFFIGTFESTFSFRIQEEREILGFKIATTFNRLCGDNQTTCQQPSKWTIVYN